MLLIGESLNVISKKIGKAFKERDPKPIQEEALFQKEKGMDYIDINLGPAKKDGPELMPWVVETVQEVVDDIPLVLDTSNIDAIEAALKVCKL
ncbi:MAG: dihydropteroate synthase, partial [Desulfobacterales bacterium]